MFSEISKNWAGHPLESFETLINFVRDTRTETGLRIEAYFDESEYEKGIKVNNKEFKLLNITKNDKQSSWNYTILPTQISEMEALSLQESLATSLELIEVNWECPAISECATPLM